MSSFTEEVAPAHDNDDALATGAAFVLTTNALPYTLELSSLASSQRSAIILVGKVVASRDNRIDFDFGCKAAADLH